MTVYTFIHPTKSGGTAFEKYFREHYRDHIQGMGHDNKCTNTNNPIIIVRDVKDRFLSMYKYWKGGSERCKRDKPWMDKYKKTTILDFIEMIKNKDKQLHTNFTSNDHLKNTSDWIVNTDYKNIIIIKYEKDMNNKIQTLINKLDIPNKNIPLPIVNKSIINIDYEKKLTSSEVEYVDKFIKEYFKKDIDLINAIQQNPELFKMVI